MENFQTSPTTNVLILIRETKIDPVEMKRHSKRFNSSESMNPGYHGSTPSSPHTVEPFQPSPVDSVHGHHGSSSSSPTEEPSEPYPVGSIESDKQKYRLISFDEDQLHKMTTPSEAGSSSSEGRLETVGDGTELAANIIDTISREAEKLSKSDVVETMRSLTLEVVKERREHWVLIAQSVAAFSAKKYNSVSSREDECTELLLKIRELAKDVEQYAEQIPDDREKLCNAVRTIVEDAIMCDDYLQEKFRFWSTTTAAAQLKKTNEQLRKMRKDYGGKDVFLCHSGYQKSFVRRLHRDLTREHISCFFDEDHTCLPLGENFPSLIFDAVATCKIAVVVVSYEFIRSKWPMVELLNFITAKNSGKNNKLKLLPIFFKISPNELSHMRNCPEWEKLLKNENNDPRDKWQGALKEVQAITGLQLREDEDEVDCREKAVKKICWLLKGINLPRLLDFKPVGIDEQVREVEKLLDMDGAHSALAVIVYGFGKTTLVEYVVDSLDWPSMDFKFCMVAIDDKAPDKTSHIIKLQKNILYDIEGVEQYLRDPRDGLRKIKEAQKKKWCLFFIDNVVDKEYIQFLLPKFLSSDEQETKLRIIITSREKNVKAELNPNIMCKEYEMKGLSDADSKSLLWERIQENEVVMDNEFDEERMITEVAAACKGVPLLLTVFGKHLREERNKHSYHEALDVLREGNLESDRDEDLRTRLMFVYDKIKDSEVREAFLDICTYFHGCKWNLVVDIVDVPKLEDLNRRRLVSKSNSGEVIVHDILRLMGRKEAKRTRFSNYEELSDAFEDGVRDVKGISLVSDDTIQSTHLEAVHRSLRILALDRVELDGLPCDKAFRNLRYLRVGDINAFPFQDPSKLKKLKVYLNRSKPGMNLSHLPSSLKRISYKVPDVECHEIAKLPFQNLSSLESLETFIVKSVELPEELHLPASLVHLNLSGCKNLPEDIGHLTALESLVLDRSDLECLPRGIGKLKKLKHLRMDDCSKLAFLPEELGMLSSLEELSMNNCENLRYLPRGIAELEKLNISMNNCSNLSRNYPPTSTLDSSTCTLC